MERGRLPGVSQPQQIVMHVDMDCFYAACERLREPPLRREPVVVGMGYEPGSTGGAVATASYEARNLGVESAMAISEALSRLPRKVDVAGTDHPIEEAGYYRPVDMTFYESVAADVTDILAERAETMRRVSIDEAYLDVTERTDWASVDSYASDLKEEIATAVGVTASVGVAPTMSAAKVASDHDKPDGLVVVRPGEVADFFAPLPVEAVHGVGPVTASALAERGIDTAGDLAAADPQMLESAFGERGREVHRFARGEDDRVVTPQDDPKSLSRESAFGEATGDESRQRERLEALARDVADRAQRRGILYRTIGIKVVTPPFDVNTRAQTVPGPVDDAELVRELALELFAEFAGSPVRKLGVRVSNLSFGAEDQPRLDEFETEEGYESGIDHDGNDDTAATDDGEKRTTEPPRRGQRSLTEYD